MGRSLGSSGTCRKGPTGSILHLAMTHDVTCLCRKTAGVALVQSPPAPFTCSSSQACFVVEDLTAAVLPALAA